MTKRLTLATCLAGVVLCSALAQSTTLALPAPAALPELAALSVDDTPPGAGDTLDIAEAEEAALRHADLLPAEVWEIPEVAATFEGDPLAAYAFVSESIATDPYDGVLRGAVGTLAARAGSSWDRALLLRALLEEGGHTARLAYGAPAADVPERPWPGGSLEVALPLPAAPQATAVIDVERLSTRARRDYALVQQALAVAGVSVAESATDTAGTPAVAAERPHAWVQVLQQDGSWLDLDPSQAQPGVTVFAATSTADAVPDELFHVVTIRLVAETLEGGETASEVVLEHRLSAAGAATQEIWLYFQPDAAGLGGAMADLFEGKSYLPVLMIDGETRPGTPFSLGGDEDSFFGGFLGSGGSELISLRLELTTSGPSVAPIMATRTLFDRVAPSDREAGVIMTDLLEPLPAGGVPAVFSALHHVMVSTGGANPRQHAVARAFAANFAGNELLGDSAAAEYPLADLLLPLAVADQTLVVASERMLLDGLRADNVRAYVGHPRVYLSTLEPVPGDDGATAMTIDLALDGVSFVLANPAADVFAWQLWYGALQSALETELTLARSRAVDPATGGVVSVSLAMSAARGGGQALSVLEPSSAASVPAAATALRSALRAGDLAVVAGDAARGGGFWAIDPVSGTTRSVMEPGVRVGFTWGRNYTNASSGGARWVVDPRTANTIGYEKDGKFYRYNRKPPSRCSGGTEYVMLLGCVSIPAGMTLGMTYGVIVTAIVSWAIAVIEAVVLL